MSKNKKSKQKKTGLQKAIKVIAIILIVLIIICGGVIAGGWTYFNGMLGKMQKESIDENAIGIDEKTEDDLSNYRNIALLGIDSREDDYGLGNRSDCIIIASINKKTNNVKLFSVYRDTYLQLEENGTTRLDKVTHAYSYGGAQNALLALNTNLDLNIKEYITVNFDAVIAAVDALGGVTINVTSDELKYLNDYISATAKSSVGSDKKVTSVGTQTLNGVQAVAYSRIRYTAGGDYKRAERMRTVVEAMVTKAKTLGVTKLISVANTILPRVSTNIDQSEIIGLIPSLMNVNFGTSIGWPYTTKGVTLNSVWYGAPVTLEENVIKLHQEIFEDEDYELPDEIKAISDQIVAKTGYSK